MISGAGLPCCGARRRTVSERGAEGSPPLLELSNSDGAFEELYQIGEKLGAGSFGTVYACKLKARWYTPSDRADGADQPLAVKVVPTQGRHCSRQSKLGEDEQAELVRLFMELSHPNIVRHRQFVETSSALYIVMDRCEGPDLLGHVEACGEVLTFDAVRTVAQQILGALAAVHALGMMHRDVKPENFRFKDLRCECLQLLDFGAAKPAPRAPTAHSVTGTLLFAAPEVFDSFYNCLCDVWSAGIVLFLLISGYLPFETSDVTMLRSMHKDPVLTGDSLLRGPRWHKAPPALRSFIRELLAVDPSLRVEASAALQHRWLVGGESVQEGDGRPDGEGGGGLRARSRSASIVDLKRSYFVWNLADNEDEEEEELPDDEFPMQQVIEEESPGSSPQAQVADPVRREEGEGPPAASLAGPSPTGLRPLACARALGSPLSDPLAR